MRHESLTSARFFNTSSLCTVIIYMSLLFSRWVGSSHVVLVYYKMYMLGIWTILVSVSTASNDTLLNTTRLFSNPWPADNAWPFQEVKPRHLADIAGQRYGVSHYGITYSNPGRRCVWAGQQMEFGTAWSRMYEKMDAYIPGSYEGTFNGQWFRISFKGQGPWTTDPGPHSRVMWSLAQTITRTIVFGIQERQCMSLFAHTFAIRPHHDPELLGTLRIVVKEPPVFHPVTPWPVIAQFPFSRPVEHEPDPTTRLRFLDAVAGGRALHEFFTPIPTYGESYPPYTSLDPFLRTYLLSLIDGCLRRVALMNPGDAYGQFQINGFNRHSSRAELEITVARIGTHPFPKRLVMNTFTTLKHLVVQGGMISCMVEVQHVGVTVGYIAIDRRYDPLAISE